MDFQDKTLRCKDCGKDFIYPAEMQKKFAEMDFHDPVRCGDCRRKKKARFNNGNRH